MTYQNLPLPEPTKDHYPRSLSFITLRLLETAEPLWYPPQSDPHIISDVFHGKSVQESSLGSYKREAEALVRKGYGT